MDYDKLIERFRYDAADWGGDPHIKRDLLDAATAITDLLARAEAAEARAEKAEKERKAALKWIREFLESIDMPCKGCKHDTTWTASANWPRLTGRGGVLSARLLQ